VDVKNPNNQCSGVPADAKGRCYLSANRPNKFAVHGALVGGPKTKNDAGDPNRIPYSTEGWNDWRTDWVGSEQAVDYNAHFTLALAAAIDLPKTFWTTKCGGRPTVTPPNKSSCSALLTCTQAVCTQQVASKFLS
jgi:Glycosyl hydrolase family 9